MEKLVLNVSEAGRLLGLGRNTVYESIRRGEIPHVRVGKRILIPKETLVRFLSPEEIDKGGNSQLAIENPPPHFEIKEGPAVQSLAPRRSRQRPTETESKEQLWLADYRSRVATNHRETDFEDMYNAPKVTDVAIYSHLDIDKSRYYKCLAGKLGPRVWERIELEKFLKGNELPRRLWTAGEYIGPAKS